MTTAAPCAQPHEHPLKQNGDMSQGKATTHLKRTGKCVVIPVSQEIKGSNWSFPQSHSQAWGPGTPGPETTEFKTDQQPSASPSWLPCTSLGWGEELGVSRSPARQESHLLLPQPHRLGHPGCSEAAAAGHSSKVAP